MLIDTFVAMSTDQGNGARVASLERIESQISVIQRENKSFFSRFHRLEARESSSVPAISNIV